MLPMLEMVQQARPETTIIVHGDALSIDYQALIEEHWVPAPPPAPLLDTDPVVVTPPRAPKPAVQVVGNLPFGVATPLLMRFLRMASEGSGVFCHGTAALTLAFQKEVAFRMLAPPKSKYRCRLSAAVQRYCRVKHRFDINPKSFTPPPKVNTSVVHLTRHPQLQGQQEVDFTQFETVTTAAFNARRRRLRHGIQSLFNNDMAVTDAFLQELEMSEATALRLSNQDLMRLAWAYTTYRELHPERVTQAVVKQPRRMKQAKSEAPPS